MSNFQSHQTYEPEGHLEPARETGVRINVYDTVQRVSTVDGVMTDVSSEHQKGHSGQINPHHGTGSVLATAKSPNGFPVSDIEPDTLITIDGVEATAARIFTSLFPHRANFVTRRKDRGRVSDCSVA